jgi:hypothetical protein
MPARKNRTTTTKRTPPTTTTSSTTTETPRTETRTGPSRTPLEEGMELWTGFARQSGDAIGEFLRHFGEEQQKNYERWVATLRDTSRPLPSVRETEDVEARFEEWNRVSRQIAEKVTDAFLTTMGPQRETFETIMRPFLPTEASSEERTRQMTDLVTKFWRGMYTDVARRFVEGFQPGKNVEDFVQLQEDALKDFGENYQKLAHTYFTSPAFVTLFGRTLDASLEVQRAFGQEENLLSRVTGLPSRREITELNQAVRDLSAKVERISKGA